MIALWCLYEELNLSALFNRAGSLLVQGSDENSLNASNSNQTFDYFITKYLMYWKIWCSKSLKYGVGLVLFWYKTYFVVIIQNITTWAFFIYLPSLKCNFLLSLHQNKNVLYCSNDCKEYVCIRGKANNASKWLLLFLFMTLFSVVWLLERTDSQHIAIWNNIMKNTCLLMQELNWQFVIGKICRINKMQNK